MHNNVHLGNASEYNGAPSRRERPIDHEDVARAEAEGEEHGTNSSKERKICIIESTVKYQCTLESTRDRIACRTFIQ